jgi:hypothetical protein
MYVAMAQECVVKKRKGKPLWSGHQTSVLNIFSKLHVENPEITLEDVTELTPEATGVSKATIYRLHLMPNQEENWCQATQLCVTNDNFNTCAAHT